MIDMTIGEVLLHSPPFGWYHVIVLVLTVVCAIIPFVVIYLPWGLFDGANLRQAEVEAEAQGVSQETAASIIVGGTVPEVRSGAKETARVYNFPAIDRRSLDEGALTARGSQPLPRPVRTDHFRLGEGSQAETPDDSGGGKAA